MQRLVTYVGGGARNVRQYKFRPRDKCVAHIWHIFFSYFQQKEEARSYIAQRLIANYAKGDIEESVHGEDGEDDVIILDVKVWTYGMRRRHELSSIFKAYPTV